jgi:hypothetical protein
MTDRLSTLLHHEVDRLDIPTPRSAEVIAQGRRAVRRRSWTAGLAAVAVAAIAASSIGMANRHHGGAAPATTTTGAPQQLAYSIDDTVYLGDGAVHATMPEVPQTLYYTSAGVVVRTNRTGNSDGGAPFHFELVGPDGSVSKLGVTLGEVVPSTDPEQPYLAWATMTGGHIQVVVHDVTTDQDVATVDVPGAFTWGGWSAPPVSLSGDQVYVATDGMTRAVDWHTGAVTEVPSMPVALPEVHAGRAVAGATVIDASTGATLFTAKSAQASLELSPDGRFVMVGGAPMGSISSFAVYDVDTGHRVTLDGDPYSAGWSSTHEVFTMHGDHLVTCDPVDGQCTTARAPATPSATSHAALPIRYAGRIYES